MPRFFTTTDASPFSTPGFPHFDFRNWFVLNCRHGRALLETDRSGLIVWNPIIGNLQHLPNLLYKYNHNTGAVLCTVDGCNHVDCRGGGGTFRVVFAARTSEEHGVTWVSVYSLETGEWTTRTLIQLGPFIDSHNMMGPSLLAGDALYFIIEEGRKILKYDLGGDALSVIKPPPLCVGNMVLMTAEGGGLGVAGVKDYRLHLCRGGLVSMDFWDERRAGSSG
ncbi:uncharacterized protein LOC133892187 [Phragmites australis]|uniref:uncharacterized protein LOC133892187 n=1 Tax=Phragmites australis TaxID=29695 RepID=UPI002D782DA6|nr:uncharacterized protein LOC133892187 [Phragmites australis]